MTGRTLHRFTGAVAPLAFVIIVFIAAQAQAALLGPSSVLFPSPSEPGPTGGTLLASTAVPFVAGTFSGTLTTEVFNNDSANPFGPTGHTFTYRLTNNGGSGHDIQRLAISNYTGFSTDASHNAASGTVIPTMITRSSGAGNVVGFNFDTPTISAGQTAMLLVVQTNATSFNPTTAAVQNGTNAQVASFAPLAVPEPATVSVLAFAAGAALLRRRR